MRTILLTWIITGLMAAAASAQFGLGDQKGTELDRAVTQRWQAGVTVEAVGGPCRGLVGTIPVPTDWPEQVVTIAEEDISRAANVTYGMHDGVRRMQISIRSLPSGEEARAVVTFEVRRNPQRPPVNSEIYRLATDRELTLELRPYVGPSLPHIDSRHKKIRSLADEIGVDAENAWKRVEAIYEYVRDKVQYSKGALKGADKALEDGSGNEEDLAFAFIAICRAAGIPARTVWVPSHCYPEFYLVDDEGKGHWFPCQVAGPAEFGGISEHRPILQKGDNFRDPRDRRNRVRYLPETLDGAGGRPKVRFIRQLAPN